MSQKGVDLMEELPGISNVYLRLIGADVDVITSAEDQLLSNLSLRC